MRERTILINSLSKEFCMTGWRIGYVLAPEEVIATMTKLQENIAACVPLPSQYAAIKALGGEADYSGRMVEIFLKRRNLLVDGISKIPRLALFGSGGDVLSDGGYIRNRNDFGAIRRFALERSSCGGGSGDNLW